MTKTGLTVLVAFAVLVLVIGGMAILGRADIKPATQHVERVVADEQIPR
jgi:hypothetical protein